MYVTKAVTHVPKNLFYKHFNSKLLNENNISSNTVTHISADFVNETTK